MAKSRDAVPYPPVESSDDSGEEEDSSSEEESDSSESEPEPPGTQDSQAAKKPTPAAVKKPEQQPSKTQPADSSSDDDESDTDSDTLPTKKPNPNIKPIASKPMDEVQKSPTTRKPRSKSNASGPTSPTKPTPSPGAKRPSGAVGVSDGETKDAKRSKKKSETGVETVEKTVNSNDDSKKLFQRLWSEDDEIAILQGMIDYQAKKKADPVADLNAFLEFIKKSLHIDVSRTQLQDKIRRLKKKYENNASKGKKGKEKVFSKAHEQMSYELSKKIWGQGNSAEESVLESPKVNGTAVRKSRTKNAPVLAPKLDEPEEAVKEDKILGGEKSVEGLKGVHIGLGSQGIEGWIAKKGMEVIKGEKREEMEEKWKKLNVEEIEIYAKKLELMLEQTKSVLEALKSSVH
ncbi:hypothetical protein M9H77_25666 [Catharanthus roseus]|uniref:Uncharacterized protein n=1 Tax=Catharanthus roseus TaxID=4058 RepID=A0ACC0ABR3_CATRO|nr:hypothetical protein M9H77_25666 [Catharanthus roseus]